MTSAPLEMAIVATGRPNRSVLLGLSAVSLCCLTVAACSDSNGPFECRPGQPVTVDFRALSTFRTATLVHKGMTVTGSDSVSVVNLKGLGVAGGLYADAVDDTSEFLKFVVDAGAAIDVSYFVPTSGGPIDGTPLGEAIVEAFDRSARSLGTRSVSLGGTFHATTAFDSVPIGAVVMKSNGSGDFFRVGLASFTPCQ